MASNSESKSALRLGENHIDKAINKPLKEARQFIQNFVSQKNKQAWSALPYPAKNVTCMGYFCAESKWDECAKFPISEDSCQAAFPQLLKGNELQFKLCRSNELLSNSLNIKEAPAHAKDAQLSHVFVPALAVDHNGHRIGRGLGFYDRYLSKHPEVVSIAVIHSDYVFQEFPKEWIRDWDQRVQLVITEKEIIDCQSNYQKSKRSKS